WRRLAGDHVHHGRLARAVRPDDATQFAYADVHAELVQRLEAVEAHRDVVQIQDDAVAGIHPGRRDPTIRCVAAIIGNGHGFLPLYRGMHALELVRVSEFHDGGFSRGRALSRRTSPTMP